jgi:hypothetical protein
MSKMDDHPERYRRRACTEVALCKVCKSWTIDKHSAVARMIDKHKIKGPFMLSVNMNAYADATAYADAAFALDCLPGFE